jgi:hypothetical protein
MCSFNLAEKAYVEQTELISSLKTMTDRKYSFQKLIQFSHRNNMLEAAASNIDGFFGEIHVGIQLT